MNENKDTKSKRKTFKEFWSDYNQSTIELSILSVSTALCKFGRLSVGMKTKCLLKVLRDEMKKGDLKRASHIEDGYVISVKIRKITINQDGGKSKLIALPAPSHQLKH